ncbi:hypothetical protein [Streptomyces sp. NPDC059008]|uniref:hypothetical protein n=1 Tax=Streptomyces sp. NPDC059008 TaxID=3346693 RepID=UPI00369A993A
MAAGSRDRYRVRLGPGARLRAYALTGLDGGAYTLIAGGCPPAAASVSVGAAGRSDCDIELGHDPVT